MPFDRRRLAETSARLAARGVFIGTSSWKYPGWCGALYDENRYLWRGRFAQSRFERECLEQYARVFSTVCVDAAYYKFPEPRQFESLVALVPSGFQFGLKVTDEITVKHFPNLPRFGPRAGRSNPNFLNPDRFATAFIEPLEPFRSHVGLLMFEFSRFHSNDYRHGRDFVADLDRFLATLPAGWPYGVEIRNPHFLHPEYFASLRQHQVAHVFNSWSAMPPVQEQMALAGSRPHSGLCAARFLLTPGRTYEEAVKRFQPYQRTQAPDLAARAAGAALILEGLARPGTRRTFIFVNNRLEGNALETIDAMIEQAGGLARSEEVAP